MSRACHACIADMKHQVGGGYSPMPDVHRPARAWWDRKPGWVRDEIRAALRRPQLAEGWRTKPTRPTLAAISARLARAELTDPRTGEVWTGPRAAEEWTLYRRAQLGLDVRLDLFREVA